MLTSGRLGLWVGWFCVWSCLVVRLLSCFSVDLLLTGLIACVMLVVLRGWRLLGCLVFRFLFVFFAGLLGSFSGCCFIGCFGLGLIRVVISCHVVLFTLLIFWYYYFDAIWLGGLGVDLGWVAGLRGALGLECGFRFSCGLLFVFSLIYGDFRRIGVDII